MALNYVTVTGTFDDGAGNPVNASVVFTPSQQVYFAGIPVVSVNNPINASVVSGSLSQKLLATDNSGVTFEAGTGFWYWTVSITLNGVVQPSWSFFLPHLPASVDLFALANTVAGGGFNSPMTTLGDLITEDATPTAVRLPGNTSAARKFLRQQGTGTVSALPAWDTLVAGDIPALGQMAGRFAYAVSALTFGASIAVDASLGNVFTVTLTNSTGTLANPTNPLDGQPMWIRLTQPASGGPSTVAYGSAYDFGAAGIPVLSIAANAVDVLSFQYSAALSKWIYMGSALGN